MVLDRHYSVRERVLQPSLPGAILAPGSSADSGSPLNSGSASGHLNHNVAPLGLTLATVLFLACAAGVFLWTTTFSGYPVAFPQLCFVCCGVFPLIATPIESVQQNLLERDVSVKHSAYICCDLHLDFPTLVDSIQRESFIEDVIE